MWYIGYFLTHRGPIDGQALVCFAREELCLLRARDSDSAYARCLEVAQRSIDRTNREKTGGWILDGISDLLRLMDDPGAGCELAWREEELPPKDLQRRIRNKEDLTVFKFDKAETQGASEWYICAVVLAEVHDSGTHGESALVWTNSYLIRAKDAESAYLSAVDIGHRAESASGSHKCDGDSAHWEFRGLSDLVHALAPPADGVILSSREFSASLDEIRALIPPRSELGVYEWESRRSKSLPSA